MTNKSQVSVVAGIVIGVAFLLFSSVRARADELNFRGTDTGTFSATGTNVYQGLTYSAAVLFGGVGPPPITTVGGFAPLNLGLFTLQFGNYSYGGNFTLTMSFNVPSGVSTNPFIATVDGNVSGGLGGTAVFNFGPSQHVTFNNGVDYGSFDLSINGLSVQPGGSAELTGQITNAQEFPVSQSNPVPEPPTILLSAVGIAGLFLLKGRLLSA